MQPASVSAQTVNEQPQFPPLAISDLLVLTLTVSVALAVIAPDIHNFLALPIEQLRIPRWRGVAQEITEYTAIGISLFGLIVLARQRIRASAFTLAPGHWIFLETGPYLFLLLVSGAANQLLMVTWFDTHPGYRHLQSLLFATVLTLSVVFALPGLRAQEPRWCVCLALILIWLFIGAAECVQKGGNIRGP